MQKIILLICCYMFGLSVIAQKQKVQVYVDTYNKIAIAEMQRSGVPAAITLAQGLLESGFGESELCKKSNNHFGIKCKTEWTGEKVYHDDDLNQECFRKYNSALESFRDHSNFLKTREWYNFLFTLDPKDYKAWAKGLKKAGYATEKNYPELLIKIIEDYNLHQYTLQALNTQPTNTTMANSIGSVEDTTVIVQDTVLAELTFQVPSKKTIINTVQLEDKQEDSVVINNPNLTKENLVKTVESEYPTGVFTINHCKVIYAIQGTSTLALAKEQNMALAKLFEYNDLQEVDILPSNQLIFIEKKQQKGSTDFYIVKANECLHYISQKEGVRLDKLLEYNKLKKDALLTNGQKIYLRPMPIK